MKIQIYNSQSHKKEEFEPLTPGEVKMYVCGPTVYDFLHVGNFRGAIFFNLVRNWFEYRGYKVTFVYNYTDVDDKIITRAQADKVDSREISERFIAEFEKDFNSLKLKKHSANPRVTEYMNPIIRLVETLIAKGKAYAVDGDVYFDVHQFPEYGKLSRKNLDDLESGVRIDVDARKKHPADFALWKASKPGEPSWDSPWGRGRPGWHIECSAMARELLGESIDIHGGGLDLIFPHHENEVAQSEGASGETFARYWMHNNMLNFGSQKMSKSLGNVRTARSFLQEYHPEIFKYLMLSAHYRSLLDFSPASIENVIASLARIYSALALAEKAAGAPADPKRPGDSEKLLNDTKAGVEAALDDDFNTPEALARLFEIIRAFNNTVRTPGPVTPKKAAVSKALLQWTAWLGNLSSLFAEPPQEFLRYLDDMLLKQKNLERAEIDRIVGERSAARAAKDFAKSDELRGRLQTMGISVQDSPQGSEWEVAK
ncbi:MAG TPA: cysteine--tRNA ligase [Bdellovibrionales bacterium]|nr:cysteine--tRNA ligase [Bdellovibrionales bacterium]